MKYHSEIEGEMVIHTVNMNLKDYTVYVKEARNKREHTAWFHLYGVLEQTKLIYSDRTLRGRCGDWLGKGKRQLSGENGNFYILKKA